MKSRAYAVSPHVGWGLMECACPYIGFHHLEEWAVEDVVVLILDFTYPLITWLWTLPLKITNTQLRSRFVALSIVIWNIGEGAPFI